LLGGPPENEALNTKKLLLALGVGPHTVVKEKPPKTVPTGTPKRDHSQKVPNSFKGGKALLPEKAVTKLDPRGPVCAVGIKDASIWVLSIRILTSVIGAGPELLSTT
jgi:hypothetical protein